MNALVQTLNFSVFIEVIQIKKIFDTVLGKNFTFRYELDGDSNKLTTELSTNVGEFHQCSSVYDCKRFPLFQTSQSPKSYLEFVESTLLDNRVDLQKTVGFGVGPLYQFFSEFQPPADSKETLKIQSGGGSGFGFQLYCDKTVVMTVGGTRAIS
jgi:hypothetical protein